MLARGLDVSRYNKPTLSNLLAWRELGFCICFVNVGIGLQRDELADYHFNNLQAAGYLRAPYQALHEAADPRAQAQLLVGSWHDGMAELMMSDLERPGLTGDWIRAFLREYHRLTLLPLWIYTNQSRWHKYFPTREQREEAAYGHDLFVAGYPFDRSDYLPDGTWQGQRMDPASVALRSSVPVDRYPELPYPWQGYAAWQHTGHGRLPNYGRDLDLSVYAVDETALRLRFGKAGKMARKLRLGVSHGLGGQQSSAYMQLSTVTTLVGDLGLSVEAPDGHIVVGRMPDKNWFPGGTYNTKRLMQIMPAKHAALVHYQAMKPYIKANPRVDFWCGPNEDVVTTPAEMAYYADFSAEYARLIALHHPGRAAALGGFATGTPDHTLWPHWIEALQAMRQYHAIYHRHTYGDNNYYLGLRYRVDYAHFSQLGFGDVRMVLTEAGADNAGTLKPWRQYYNGDILRYYNELLEPLELLLEQDAYVLGACIFTCGGGWPDFDVDNTGLLPLLQNLANTERKDPAVIHTFVIDNVPAELKQAYVEHINALTRDVNENGRVLPYGQGATLPWYVQISNGLISPTKKARPLTPLTILNADGANLGLARRTNNVDLYEKRTLPDGRVLFRVISSPIQGQLWWVLATELELLP